MTTKIKLNTNGSEKEYEIDITRAQELGICKEVAKPIKRFQVGDIFKSPSSSPVMIIQSNWTYNGDNSYNLAGLNGLNLFSNFMNPQNKYYVLDYLNSGGYKFVKNINEEIHNLINS